MKPRPHGTRSATGLGAEFVASVRAATASILEAPERWPLVKGTRRALLHRFPYAFVYREATDETVELVAVGHCKRRPRFRSGR